MTDDRKAGLAFIAGSIGGMVTMAIHPTSGGVLTPAQFERLAVVSGIAHSLAMVSFLVMFLGSIGLTRRLAAREGERPDRLAISGLVGYGFGAVALLLATAVSGFIVPDIMRHMIRDGAANVSQWRMIIDAVFQFNQAFARIYSVAASVAVMLWSVSALRNGGLGKVIAVYGCLIAPVLIVLIGVGHLRLDVHGMAVVVLAHAIWFVGVGVEMWRGTSDGNDESQVSEVRAGASGQ
jgi:heme A synthase